MFRYYAADTLQQTENVTNPAKCLTATDLDTGVVAGRCLRNSHTRYTGYIQVYC